MRGEDADPLPRRRLLAAAGVAFGCLGAGCTETTRPSAAGTTTSPSSSEPANAEGADAALVAAVVRAENRLLDAYQAVLGGSAGTLHAFAEHHRQHVLLLGGLPDQRTGRRRLSRDLQRLRDLEDMAATRLRGQALAARSGDLARVLASMSASSAQHAVVLNRLRTPTGHAGRHR